MDDISVIRKLSVCYQCLHKVRIGLGLADESKLFASCTHHLCVLGLSIHTPAMVHVGSIEPLSRTLMAIWIKTVESKMAEHKFREAHGLLAKLISDLEHKHIRHSDSRAEGFDYSDEVDSLLATALESLSSVELTLVKIRKRSEP